jgi:hypothetical protein
MITEKKTVKNYISVSYVLVIFIAVLFTWLLHEFAHWLTGEMLGNDMAMTMNASYPVSGKYQEPWHEKLVSAAGPLVTILQAFLFSILLSKGQNRSLFPFLITCLYMRFLAGAMNVVNPNDEGRISRALGLGLYTLPVMVNLILFFLVWQISKSRNFKQGFITRTVLLIMLFSSVLILSDQVLRLTILR